MAWQPDTAPAWARPLLGHRPGLLAEIAVFRAAHDVDPADTRTVLGLSLAAASRAPLADVSYGVFRM